MTPFVNPTVSAPLGIGTGLFDFAANSAPALAAARSTTQIAEDIGLPFFDQTLALPPVGARVAAQVSKRASANPVYGAARESSRQSEYYRELLANRGDAVPWIAFDGSSPPSSFDVAGAPSLKLYYEDGAACVELRRNSRYASMLHTEDLSAFLQIGNQVLAMLEALSRGPYTSTDLAAMGHPYGIDTEQEDGKVKRVPRKLERFFRGKSIGHTATAHNGGQKGHGRGTVPSLVVVNSQSGKFASSWEMDFRLDAGGVSLIWRNNAQTDKGFPYAWALASGTRGRGGKGGMRAHGPFTYAPLQFLAQLDKQWRHLARTGWQRSQHDALLSALVG